MTIHRQRLAVARQLQFLGRGRRYLTVRSLESRLARQVHCLAIAGHRRLPRDLATSHVGGSFTAVEIVGSWTHRHTHATTRTDAVGGRTACRRTTSRWLAAADLLFNRDLFIGLRDHPRNTVSVLQARIETLAFALIKRPGAGEVCRRGSMHGQSDYERAHHAQSAKQLSHSRSPYYSWDCPNN